MKKEEREGRGRIMNKAVDLANPEYFPATQKRVKLFVDLLC